MKKCPYCAEVINDDATYCRYCRHYLGKRSGWIWLVVLFPVIAIAALLIYIMPGFLATQGQSPDPGAIPTIIRTATLPDYLNPNNTEPPVATITIDSNDNQGQELQQSSTSVPPSIGSSPLRIPSMPGVTFIADDHNTTPEITKAIANNARYLAIPSPYTWEVFQCSMGMHYQNIKDYYKLATKPLGFQVAIDQISQYETYLLTFVNKWQKITLQFNNDVIGSPPFFMVFYSHL